ncbi:MAG: type I-E CRISPR-associated protein Cas5/CasD, partial [Oscillospiraceae bacterium]|nr:type I-E CRISPR-associated protein Cas5/CasD [Oscillospiraceae bacterium]
MATLLLRLSAPLQSWGAESKFEVRRTMNFPTKSGVLGLVAAALGYSREDSDSLKKLNTLKFGIRIDHEGELLRDFHMAKTKK